jgi:hypothetical protein
MLIVTNKPIMLGVVMPNVVTLNVVAARMFIPNTPSLMFATETTVSAQV